MHEAVSSQLFDQAVGGLTPELCESRGWRIAEQDFPVLDVEFTAATRTAFRVRLTCDGWNSQPAAVSFHSADGAFLAQLPIGPQGQFNNSPHPSTGRPFLCMAGAREYHQHLGHVGDVWDNYRERPAYDLGGLLTQIWGAWRGARP